MNSVYEYERQNKRSCSVLAVGGFRPTNNPFASNIGIAPVGRPDETWPSTGGIPLPYICQINLADAPFLPEELKDIALITFFMDVDTYLKSDRAKDRWCIRAYQSLEGLVPLEPPQGVASRKGFECRWTLCEADYPVYDDPGLIAPTEITNQQIDEILENEQFNNIKRTKVGGWASNIQHAPYWGEGARFVMPKYCLQIDSEAKANLNWVDNGTVYIARSRNMSTAEEWFIDLQFY